MSEAIAVRRGYNYYYIYKEHRYNVHVQPFRKLLNKLRQNPNTYPFDTIRIGNELFVINPFLSGKGSQNPLVPIDLNQNGQPSRRSTGQPLLNRYLKRKAENIQNRIQQYYAQEAHNFQSIAVEPYNPVRHLNFITFDGNKLRKRLETVSIAIHPALSSIADVEQYLRSHSSDFIQYLQHIPDRFPSCTIRWSYDLRVLSNDQPVNQYILVDPNLYRVLYPNDIEPIISSIAPQFLDLVTQLEGKGSSIRFKALKSITVWVSKYEAPSGGSYVPLPKKIYDKRCCINVKNEDNKCLRWAVLSCLYLRQNPEARDLQRVNKYKDMSLNDQGVEYPATLKDVNRLEKQNDIAINVYAYSEGKPSLSRYSMKPKTIPRINLLLYQDHYCWIKNFDDFMNCKKQEEQKHHKYYCDCCGCGFFTREILAKHKENECQPQFVRLPEEKEAFVKFKAFSKMHQHPCVVYADFEASLQTVTSQSETQTKVLQIHKPIAYALQSVCRDKPEQNKFYIDVCENAGDAFVNKLIEMAPTFQNLLKTCEPMNLTPEEEQLFQNATHCSICGGAKQTDEPFVRDHNHCTGAFRGAAHNKCNLNLKMPTSMPVLFHNFKGYDSNFVLQSICKLSKQKGLTIDAIAESSEKFKCITIRFMVNGSLFSYRFIDSFAFLSESLDTLAKNLQYSKKYFTSKEFPKREHFEAMTIKGFFPYDVVKNMQSLDMQKLPEYNELKKPTLGSISEEEYQRGLNVWKLFDCKTLKDYLQVYLRTDVLLLTDVFEEFRSLCLQDYKLDPVHYVSLPAMSWDALLSKTKVRLDLLTDPDMFTMVENAKRGGVSFIGHRYAKANNPLCPEFNPLEPKSWLLYLDANNLYGKAMSMSLPVGNFKWVMMTEEELLKVNLEGKIGYFVECNLLYPYNPSHEMHPLAPENRTICFKDLSPYQQQFNIKSMSTKLITSFLPKEKYVCHIRNFQQYLSLGMKCSKVYRVLEFNQSPWMEPFIDFNTRKRKDAKNKFEEDLYKLMNNSVFGKSMENVRSRTKTKFVTNGEKVQKYLNKPNYTGMYQELQETTILFMDEVNVLLNKPITVGASILDISKTIMYDFHYNVMVHRYGYENMKLCMTDTDSLLYYIHTETDINMDMKSMGQYFDMSGYDNPMYKDNTNKKVLGKFKDEEPNNAIIEFVGLRAKLYAYRTSNLKEKKRCKGTKKYVVNTITMEEYQRVLFAGKHNTREETNRSMRGVRSKNHELQTYEMNKISLSAYDDKRYICEDGITTRPWGWGTTPNTPCS